MSNPGSVYSNNEEILQEPKPTEVVRDSNHDDLLKLEVKVPSQVNFGRPRKHPYKPGKYKCEYCEVMCSKPSVLKKHLRAHTNERPYPCSICKRSFKTKSNLSKHMKSKSHSSNSLKAPTNKEKASLMLQALSGLDVEHPKSVDGSNNNIEYDCIEKSTEPENSPTISSDDRSVMSDDNSTEESVKRGSVTEHCMDKREATDNDLSSCSGMLTINSQSGPITVEVEIKLETMKQLREGLSHMTMKKYNPSSPSSITSRNDADVRAAESILHMANQRRLEGSSKTLDDQSLLVNYENKLVAPKEEQRPADSTNSQGLFNMKPKLQDIPCIPLKSTKNSSSAYHSKAVIRNRVTNKNIPNEDQKKLKKCLVESLLKKMQKKTEKYSKQSIVTNSNGGGHFFSNNSGSEVSLEYIPSSPNSLSYNMPPKKIFGINSNTNSYSLNTLISDSKSPSSLLSFNTTSGKQAVILQRTIPSNSKTLNIPISLPANPAILLLSSYSEHIQTPQRNHSPISATNFKVDTTTDVLSKVFNNTQSLYKHHCCNAPMEPTIPISSSHVKATHLGNIKEESIIKNLEIQESSDNSESTDDSDNPSYNHQTSTQTTHESDAGSSPRLCIVEESTIVEEPPSQHKKNAESDEEIDVVNTDSDDNDPSMTRLPDRGGVIYMNKKRKGHHECDVDHSDSEAKKMKEMEKTVTLHAPNINAEDLVQDCPLNLSANRHPIIPSCQQNSQISASVLENIYRPMVTSSNVIPDSSIAALTNTNPAHPLSLVDNSLIEVSLPNNGHHINYPIFEDKVLCEVCSQLIEPSKLNLHKTMHIYTDGKDQQCPNNNVSKSGGLDSSVMKQTFNKPRTYRCVVCRIGFRVMGHLSKHHKSKSHLQGLVNSGLLSKTLNAKIEESKVPIAEVIDQKTGNIIPGVLSKYLSDWSQSSSTDSGSSS